MAGTVRVDLVSDIICPWCYIGLKRLDAAQRLLEGDITLDLHWHPFQLDPTLPPDGKDRRAYLEDKFGGPEGARAAYARVEQAGASEGIAFDFNAIRLTPNTLDGHRLLAFAATQPGDAQTRLARALFAAYFERGENLASRDTLLGIAEQSGLDREAASDWLDNDATLKPVQDELAMAARVGISGVPFFIVNNAYGISGAQPAETLADAFRQIATDPQPAA